MTNDRNVVSENIVQLIFNQVKESLDRNTDAVDKLADGVTILIQSIGTLPKETNDAVSRLSTVMKVVFGVIVGLFTILTFIFSYFGIGLNDVGPIVKGLHTDINELIPLINQLIRKL